MQLCDLVSALVRVRDIREMPFALTKLSGAAEGPIAGVRCPRKCEIMSPVVERFRPVSLSSTGPLHSGILVGWPLPDKAPPDTRALWN